MKRTQNRKVVPLACPYDSPPKLLDGFWWNLVSRMGIKICRTNLTVVCICLTLYTKHWSSIRRISKFISESIDTFYIKICNFTGNIFCVTNTERNRREDNLPPTSVIRSATTELYLKKVQNIKDIVCKIRSLHSSKSHLFILVSMCTYIHSYCGCTSSLHLVP